MKSPENLFNHIDKKLFIRINEMYNKDMDGEELPKLLPTVEKNPFGNLINLKDYLQNHRQPVDYAGIVSPSTRLLAIGETHSRENQKQEIIDHIGQFTDLGFTHMALEMLDPDIQPVLEDYLQTGGRKIELRNYISETYGAYSLNGTDLYLKIIDTAHAAGMEVVGINPSKSERRGNMSGTERFKKTNKHMEAKAEAILDANNKSKVIAYTGSYHAARNGGLIELLPKHITAVSVGLDGSSTNKNTLIKKAAGELGIETERFMIPQLNKYPESDNPFDWVIHLSQIESPTSFDIPFVT